jgi:hypothetical protein
MSATITLERIVSKGKRRQILDILQNPHPLHHRRVWLVGFLSYVGYSEMDIRIIVSGLNRWNDFNADYTNYQISSVLGCVGKSIKMPSAASEMTLDELILLFLSNTRPVRRNASEDVYGTISGYRRLGISVVPKAQEGKYPCTPWRAYESRLPTPAEIAGWDFQHGLCAIANDEYCWLDIDMPGYSALFLLLGYDVERTPRWGVHVLGKGHMKNTAVCGGEIRGKGTLVVVSPSPGYKKLYLSQ